MEALQNKINITNRKFATDEYRTMPAMSVMVDLGLQKRTVG